MVKVGCNWAKWLYFGKVVVFGQSGCVCAKWFYLGIPLLDGLVVFEQSGCSWAKM